LGSLVSGFVVKVFGIVGRSGSGKTTLIERLVPALVSRCLVVSLIKHAHHGFDIDRPGKDSWRHREAGCSEVLLTCDDRWALMHELRGRREPSLEELLAKLSPCDLVLIEGFKAIDCPKLEVWRPSLGKAPLFPGSGVLAVASDERFPAPIPVIDLSDLEALTDLVLSAAWGRGSACAAAVMLGG
jgi:molybdopterin-guanine dinucleotide biosynthesis protein B